MPVTQTSRTTGTSFIEDMCEEALASAAVRHPYLDAMRSGSFPDLEYAFKDFAFQYGLYSANFMQYVSAVMKQLQDDRHREILRGNLAEEQGHAHDVDLPADIMASIDGEPHSRLYRRFQDALGVNPDERNPTARCPGARWSSKFLTLCRSGEMIGAGAIGIGTEFVVASIFEQILAGLKQHSDLTMLQRVFFDLHSECDEKHAQEMMQITSELARDPESCDQIEHGIRCALALRAAFWDQMMERALAAPSLDHRATRDQEYSAVGHQESL